MSKSFKSRLTGFAKGPRRPLEQTSPGTAKRPPQARTGAGAAWWAAPAFRQPGAARPNFPPRTHPGTGRPGTGAGRKAAPVLGCKAPRRGKHWIECLDEAHEHCYAIETLSGLLRACGDDVLDGDMVRGSGNMIDDQIRQLKALLEELAVAR